MTISKDDIRAAVGAGILSELQADQLASLSGTRQGDRINLADVDEPFEVFRGFNEIFVVVGLAILFTGWFGFAFSGNDQSGMRQILFGALGGGFVALLARYFTTKRRMIAPSIALSIMFGISAVQIGTGINKLTLEDVDLFAGIWFLVPALTASGLLLAYWVVFRVPFTIAMIAVSVFVAIISAFLIGDLSLSDPMDLFLLSAEGPLALVTFGLGIIGFILAMRFDMSDPHRVTRRSLNGFWLHIVAAPAIVNTVALTLFENGSAGAQIILLLFVVGMALVAIIIDRRSFLLAGVGYVVALSTTIIDNGASVAILAFGLILILLGAGWEKFRSRLMGALPEFPGKDRLPPYALETPRTT